MNHCFLVGPDGCSSRESVSGTIMVRLHYRIMVRTGTHKQSGETAAIKVMAVVPKGSTARSNDNTWADVEAEITILCRLDHPNVIKLKEFFAQDGEVYLVTDLVQGALLSTFVTTPALLFQPEGAVFVGYVA
jgi:serine/threonine protein kinase